MFMTPSALRRLKVIKSYLWYLFVCKIPINKREKELNDDLLN